MTLRIEAPSMAVRLSPDSPSVMAIRIVLCIALLAVAATVTGCAKKPSPAAQHRYPFTGEVIRLDPKESIAVIHNQKVEGWMGAMTMEYPIPNPSEYASLHPAIKSPPQ